LRNYMPLEPEQGGTLGEFNVALAAAIPLLNPLAAQLDAMLAFALGPLQADLAAQFNASLALQASLSLQISDPLAALKAALAAIAQLQASLTAALTLPPMTMSIGAELSASAALAASLSLKLGGIKLLIEAALAVKIPAVQFAAQFAASLGAGPVYIVPFEGSTLAATGTELSAKFAGGLGPDGSVPKLEPSETVFGLVLVTSTPSAYAAMRAIINAP
jgi:hypothetical protein